jgi:hypothetical protein
LGLLRENKEIKDAAIKLFKKSLSLKENPEIKQKIMLIEMDLF